jgi:peptidoglycan/LPS O-acetylase OafA/YrhL
MTYLVVACAIRPDHPLRHVLANRPIRYIGTISYGMYLLHVLALNFARRVIVPGKPAIVAFGVALPVTVLIAGISYRYFEKRFLALKERLTEHSVAGD